MDSPTLFREGIAEPLRRIQPSGFLNMQIMPGHIDLCVTGDILDGFEVHTQQLHHGNEGMSATMWRQYADTLDLLQGFLELVTKMRR